MTDPPSSAYLDAVPVEMHAHRKKTLYFLDRLQRYADQLGIEPTAVRVLDLGCGNGRIVTLPLAERGFEVLGLDSHAPSVESARHHNTLPNARFVHGAFEEAPANGDFDAVVLSDVLEHVDHPSSMLAVAAAALRSGGIVLVSVPNGFGPYEIEQLLVRKKVLWLPLALVRRAVAVAVRAKHAVGGPPPPTPPPPAYNVDSGHVQRFTVRRLRRLLTEYGFDVTDQRNGSWFGGDLTYFLFLAFKALVPATLRAADWLPPALVSTWFLEARYDKARL